jgi:hypothetical protein
MKDKIASLVEDGRLTQAQADKINAKRAELQKTREANRDSMDDKTSTERKAAMDAEKTALDTWMDENDIDDTYAYLLMGGHGHGGLGGPRGKSASDSDS